MCDDLWKAVGIAFTYGCTSSRHAGWTWGKGLFLHHDSPVFYNPLFDGYKGTTVDQESVNTSFLGLRGKLPSNEQVME